MAFITGITLMKNEKIWIEESPRIEDMKKRQDRIRHRQ